MTEIHRTVYTVEVFSRGPFHPDGGDNDPFDLAEINYAITEGDCIGNVEISHQMIVPPEAVEGELLRIGNDGSFFDEDEDD
jgi:hypothetical protein